MTLESVTPINLLWTSLQIMGIIMVHMFSLVLPLCLIRPWPPKGYGGNHGEQLCTISLSCPFTLFNIFDGLVMFVPLVEVASIVYHVSFILLDLFFYG